MEFGCKLDICGLIDIKDYQLLHMLSTLGGTVPIVQVIGAVVKCYFLLDK